MNDKGQKLRGKRVLLLHPHMVLPGGALNYMLKLGEQLRAQGATVGILTLQVDRQKYGDIDGVELLVIKGPLTSALSYWLLFPYWQMKINRQIREWQPEVLVPQVFPANWWAWLYKRTGKAHPGCLDMPGTECVHPFSVLDQGASPVVEEFSGSNPPAGIEVGGCFAGAI